MSEMVTNEKPDYYKLAEEQPDRYMVTSSGAVKDMANRGKFVAMDASKNPHAISTETTQNMHKLRRERTRESVTQAIIEGTEAIDLSDGVKKLSLPLVNVVKAGGNRAVEAYNALLRAAGLVESGRLGRDYDDEADNPAVTISESAWNTLLDKVLEAKKLKEQGE